MSKVILVLLFIQICATIALPEDSSQDCLGDSDKFYCKLNAKSTPYRFVANYNDSRPNYPGCTETKIWMMIRHGSRFPKKKYIDSMIEILTEVQAKIRKSFVNNKSELSPDLVERITRWRVPFDDLHEDILAPEGEKEHIFFAERMRSRFPTLFSQGYSKESYKLRYSTHRTKHSAQIFFRGLFGSNASVSFSEPKSKDLTLTFTEKCTRWLQEVEENPKTYREKNSFIKGEFVQKTLSDISKRVGFQLDYKTVDLMYLTCAYETTTNATANSPWCDLLSLNDFKVLDFARDLEYYWLDGYAYHLNYESACPALRDMFTLFESPNKTVVAAYFTNTGGFLKLLSALGFAKDENHLTHKSFSLHKDSRSWKTGLIASFGSNIDFVLYDCENQEPSVLALHNERALNIPGCPDGALCPMSVMKNIFPDTEQECQFDTMCSVDRESSSNS